MIAMSGDMNIETSISKNEKGGRKLRKGLGRKLGGEGLFLNHYTAGGGGGDVFLAPSLPGDMALIELSGDKAVKVQNGSFVAHEARCGYEYQLGGVQESVLAGKI